MKNLGFLSPNQLALVFFWFAVAILIYISRDLLSDYNQLHTVEKWQPIVSGVIIAPIFEETIFRGCLYRRVFRPVVGTMVAALASAGLFAVYHYVSLDFTSWPLEYSSSLTFWHWAMGTKWLVFDLVNLTSFGILTVFIYQRSRKIWTTVIFHAMVNGSVIVVGLEDDYVHWAVISLTCILLIGLSASAVRKLIRRWSRKDETIEALV